jgi:Lipase (class 3)
VVSFGFLAVSNAKELVATIRGTDTILEWLHDGSFLMVSCPVAGAHGFTEDGFAAVYRSLRIGQGNGTLSAKDSIKSYLDTGAAASVTVCGHSLGGALAALLTLDVGLNTSCHAPTAYTYAIPVLVTIFSQARIMLLLQPATELQIARISCRSCPRLCLCPMNT